MNTFYIYKQDDYMTLDSAEADGADYCIQTLCSLEQVQKICNVAGDCVGTRLKVEQLRMKQSIFSIDCIINHKVHPDKITTTEIIRNLRARLDEIEKSPITNRSEIDLIQTVYVEE